MNANKALVFILFQGMVNVIVFASEEPASSRSAFFSMWPNKQLKGHVVKRFESPSLMSCSHSCLKKYWCTSTNFKMLSDKNGQGTCELNRHGAIDANTESDEQQGVTFSVMLKVISYYFVNLNYSILKRSQVSHIKLLICGLFEQFFSNTTSNTKKNSKQVEVHMRRNWYKL